MSNITAIAIVVFVLFVLLLLTVGVPLFSGHP